MTGLDTVYINYTGIISTRSPLKSPPTGKKKSYTFNTNTTEE